MYVWLCQLILFPEQQLLAQGGEEKFAIDIDVDAVSQFDMKLRVF